MIVKRIWKLNRRKWALILPSTALIVYTMWTATTSQYVCRDKQETDYPTLTHPGRLPKKTTDKWGNAILLGGQVKSEKVFLTIGVPTIHRENGSYLFSTLQSLINGSTEKERRSIIVVISVNDENAAYSADLMKNLRQKFLPYLDNGFVRVIRAPPAYYPSLTALKATFGDDQKRVLWRSKQNLDYAFLIHYAENLSQYYMQLEDDVIAAPDYVTKITSFIRKQTDAWTMIDFSEMGFIGKLYKNSDLPKLASLLRTFFNEQPCDFLLLHFLNLMLQNKRYIRIPTLFKHIGYHSSLHNTTRYMKNNLFFGATKTYKGDNPPAKLHTTIEDFDNNVIEMAYNKSLSGSFFWGKTPKAGDSISIIFDKPHNVTRIVITTGLSSDQEKDRLHNAILKYGRLISHGSNPPSCNAEFDVEKIETAEFDYNQKKLLNVKCLTIIMTENYTQWLLLKEIAVFVK